MVSLAVPLGIGKGLGVYSAVFVLTAFNLTSGASRLISGVISDYFGRNRIMSLGFLLAGVAYFSLVYSGSFLVYLLAAVIGFAFGTMTAVSAPLASDCFGLKHFGEFLE